MRILILDNYDSFTYNLYHYARQFCSDVSVYRNDAIDITSVNDYSHIILSPGPGLPEDAGITMAILEQYSAEKSILGVCLGFQAMALWAEAELYNQNKVAHGLSRTAIRDGKSWLLKDIPNQFKVGLYHSWAVRLKEENKLKAICRLENGTLMGFEHSHLPLAGVQFHPESIMTEHGLQMLENWVKR